MVNPRPPLGIGIVGTGQRCMSFFAPYITSHPETMRLVALADQDRARLNSAIADLGGSIRAYDHIEDLLSDADIGAVIVATPDFTHRRMFDQVLEAGKHVVCEKPMATTVEDALHMTRRAMAVPQVVQIGFMLRYAPFFVHLKQVIASGTIGPLLQVSAAEIVEFYHGAAFFRRWHRLRQNSGGLLVHKASHTLDVINWWVDALPVEVSARGGIGTFVRKPEAASRCRDCRLIETCPAAFRDNADNYIYQTREERAGRIASSADLCVYNSDKDTVDHATLMAQYANGVELTFSFTTTGSRHDRQFLIVGQRGQIKASQADGVISVEPLGEESRQIVLPEELRGDHGGGDAPLMEDFLSCIEGRHRPTADVKAGLYSVALAAAATQSIDQEGRAIDLRGVLEGV